MKIRHQVHETLSIDGHQVDYLSDCTLLSGTAAKSQSLRMLTQNVTNCITVLSRKINAAKLLFV